MMCSNIALISSSATAGILYPFSHPGTMLSRMERAYAIAGLAVGLAIILISVDLLSGGKLAALVGGAVATPQETPHEG